MKYHTIAHNNTLLLFGEIFGNKWVTLQKKGNIAKVTKRNAHQLTGISWERVTLQMGLLRVAVEAPRGTMYWYHFLETKKSPPKWARLVSYFRLVKNSANRSNCASGL